MNGNEKNWQGFECGEHPIIPKIPESGFLGVVIGRGGRYRWGLTTLDQMERPGAVEVGTIRKVCSSVCTRDGAVHQGQWSRVECGGVLVTRGSAATAKK